jgi:hypothetical protein
VGVENNSDWNFKDLEEMAGNAKALKKNSKEFDGILIGPSMVPHFFGLSEIFRRGFFTHYPRYQVGFGPQFCGTDGKPTLSS